MPPGGRIGRFDFLRLNPDRIGGIVGQLIMVDVLPFMGLGQVTKIVGTETALVLLVLNGEVREIPGVPPVSLHADVAGPVQYIELKAVLYQRVYEEEVLSRVSSVRGNR